MSADDVRAGNRAAMQAWRDKGMPIASPELKVAPPCRDCGRIPTEYSRFDDGSVQCAGSDYRDCR